MKLPLSLAFVATVAVATGQPQGFQTPVLLGEKDQPRFRQVWVVAAAKNQIRYKENENAMDTKDARMGEFGAVYILEPAEYSAAMDLFESRKYKEAREAFEKVKNKFKPIAQLDNNPSSLAAFYEMECYRQLGDLEALSQAAATFLKDPITRESQLRQLELYAVWDAARTKSWDRVETLCREREKSKQPSDQRAQVAYLHGMALEGLGKPKEALLPYHTAMTADAGASAMIARAAALRVMEIHKADPDVQQAIKVSGTPDEKKSGEGYFNLREAAAVASLYEIALGAGEPLPASLKSFLNFLPETPKSTP
jgi:tetratricopeptide (TPR) repeat protein